MTINNYIASSLVTHQYENYMKNILNKHTQVKNNLILGVFLLKKRGISVAHESHYLLKYPLIFHYEWFTECLTCLILINIYTKKYYLERSGFSKFRSNSTLGVTQKKKKKKKKRFLNVEFRDIKKHQIFWQHMLCRVE